MTVLLSIHRFTYSDALILQLSSLQSYCLQNNASGMNHIVQALCLETLSYGIINKINCDIVIRIQY